jgi:hypothetical protein
MQIGQAAPLIEGLLLVTAHIFGAISSLGGVRNSQLFLGAVLKLNFGP